MIERGGDSVHDNGVDQDLAIRSASPQPVSAAGLDCEKIRTPASRVTANSKSKDRLMVDFSL
jgi:hypothetical protein